MCSVKLHTPAKSKSFLSLQVKSDLINVFLQIQGFIFVLNCSIYTFPQKLDAMTRSCYKCTVFKESLNYLAPQLNVLLHGMLQRWTSFMCMCLSLQFLFKFLSRTNSLSHLDLSDTNCPLDTVSQSPLT